MSHPVFKHKVIS